MANYNRVIVAGNLTRDPELRFTQSGIPVCDFGLAVNRVRSKNEEVDFFDVAAWRELGETVANYKTKGDPILVEGRLQYSSWENDDGQKRSKVSIVAENVQFLGRPQGADGGSSVGSSRASSTSATSSASSSNRGEVERIDEEDFDDLPF